MNYVLITPTGRIYQFYLEVVAKTWQGAYGGTLISANESTFNLPSYRRKKEEAVA